MFSNIVVGTDGSETAAAAVALAVDLARKHDGKLHLVTAFRTPSAVGGGGVSAADPRWTGLLQARGREDPRTSGGRHRGRRRRDPQPCGAPASVIVDVADELGADLIVVGSKGMQGTRRILGSVPNTVAHNAACHVLVAKTS